MTSSVHIKALTAKVDHQPRSVWALLHKWATVAHQRRGLRALDDHILKDIGVSRHEAIYEGRKSPWNVPNHWRK